jgi:hypothetical protein
VKPRNSVGYISLFTRSTYSQIWTSLSDATTALALGNRQSVEEAQIGGCTYAIKSRVSVLRLGIKTVTRYIRGQKACFDLLCWRTTTS